jgi:hypothetical protein
MCPKISISYPVYNAQQNINTVETTVILISNVNQKHTRFEKKHTGFLFDSTEVQHFIIFCKFLFRMARLGFSNKMYSNCWNIYYV